MLKEYRQLYLCQWAKAVVVQRNNTNDCRGYAKTIAHYQCSTCRGCPYKERCFQSKRYENKLLKVKRDLIEMCKVSLANITSQEGIELRINRSIQVEGAFGMLKHDRQFKRFLTRGKLKVSIELFLLCLAFNLNKLYAS